MLLEVIRLKHLKEQVGNLFLSHSVDFLVGCTDQVKHWTTALLNFFVFFLTESFFLLFTDKVSMATLVISFLETPVEYLE